MSSPACAMAGKSSSSLVSASASGAGTCVTTARPFRNFCGGPNCTSLAVKEKLPCGTLTVKVGLPPLSPAVTIIPFSSSGPVRLTTGEILVESLQPVVPSTASIPAKRHPASETIVVSVASMVPSQTAPALSPTPKATRKEIFFGDEIWEGTGACGYKYQTVPPAINPTMTANGRNRIVSVTRVAGISCDPAVLLPFDF